MYMHYTNSLTEAEYLLDNYGYDLVLIEANSRPGIKDIPELPGRTYTIFSKDIESINILAAEFGGEIIPWGEEQSYGTYFAQGTELPDVILCTATLFPELDRLEAVNEVLGAMLEEFKKSIGSRQWRKHFKMISVWTDTHYPCSLLVRRIALTLNDKPVNLMRLDVSTSEFHFFCGHPHFPKQCKLFKQFAIPYLTERGYVLHHLEP